MSRLDSLIHDIKAGKLNFLFIGPGGSGKTYAAASLLPPTLFLDVEGGLRTVVELGTGCRAITIPQERTWQFILDLLPELLKQTTYPTICVDSLTFLSDMLLRELSGPNPDPKDTLKNYGKVIDRLKQFVYKLNTATAHVIYIAQEAASTGEDGSTLSFVPNVAGKETFARQLPAMLDEVWWFSSKSSFNPVTKKRDTTRIILTAPSGPRIGKDRAGCLSLEEELNFNELRSKLSL